MFSRLPLVTPSLISGLDTGAAERGSKGGKAANRAKAVPRQPKVANLVASAEPSQPATLKHGISEPAQGEALPPNKPEPSVKVSGQRRITTKRGDKTSLQPYLYDAAGLIYLRKNYRTEAQWQALKLKLREKGPVIEIEATSPQEARNLYIERKTQQ